MEYEVTFANADSQFVSHRLFGGCRLRRRCAGRAQVRQKHGHLKPAGGRDSRSGDTCRSARPYGEDRYDFRDKSEFSDHLSDLGFIQRVGD
jgi:hypothetical protein